MNADIGNKAIVILKRAWMEKTTCSVKKPGRHACGKWSGRPTNNGSSRRAEALTFFRARGQ